MWPRTVFRTYSGQISLLHWEHLLNAAWAVLSAELWGRENVGFVFYLLFWYEKRWLRNGEKLKRLWIISGPTVCFTVHLHATCLDKAVHSSKCKCLHKRGWIPIWFHSTHSLFLDPLGESLPGAVITHSFLFSLHSIGMATLEEPHSYTFPMLVIGLSHVAAARSPPTTSVCFMPLRLYYSFTLAECTHANGGRKAAVT